MSCELHGKAMWVKHEARGAWLLSLVLELCWISLDTRCLTFGVGGGHSHTCFPVTHSY